MAEIIEIPAQNFEALQAKVAKLNKICERITDRKIRIMPIGNRELKDEVTGRIAKVLEIYITVPDMKIPGWEFVGRIDHRTFKDTQRNYVFMNPEVQDDPKSYYNTPSHCDHCNENRRRNFTYILRNDAGELKQVGSSCLMDFLGYEPIKILKMFEYLQKAVSAAKGMSRGPLPTDYLYIDTQRYIAGVIQDIRGRGGFITSSQARSGATFMRASWQAGETLSLDKVNVLPMEEAAEAIKMAQEGPEISILDRNIKTIALSPYVAGEMLPTAALIANNWWRKQPRPVVEPVVRPQPTQEPQAPKQDLTKSTHFLSVDDKFQGKVTVLSTRIVEGYYGNSTLVRMLQGDNLIVTFASGKFKPAKGDEIEISGTVKKNDTYNGVKQTMLRNVRAK